MCLPATGITSFIEYVFCWDSQQNSLDADTLHILCIDARRTLIEEPERLKLYFKTR